MKRIELLCEALEEASTSFKWVTKEVIRQGKKVRLRVKEYKDQCPDGYKRDSITNQCVRMSSQERRNRSIAAKKSANKSSTKRNRLQSMKRRRSLIRK